MSSKRVKRYVSEIGYATRYRRWLNAIRAGLRLQSGYGSSWKGRRVSPRTLRQRLTPLTGQYGCECGRPGAVTLAALYPNWFVPAWSVGTIKVGA